MCVGRLKGTGVRQEHKGFDGAKTKRIELNKIVNVQTYVTKYKGNYPPDWRGGGLNSEPNISRERLSANYSARRRPGVNPMSGLTVVWFFLFITPASDRSFEVPTLAVSIKPYSDTWRINVNASHANPLPAPTHSATCSGYPIASVSPLSRRTNKSAITRFYSSTI